ncbi:MAG: tRNA (adenosine(37)-N6)-threonylcarbamoyltransferase complex dimerization subunit type 1 TsaB, partial [Eubacterium sp.]|nr:tRNA (adenosine(37)-N6)-threonylcarbamoyltransferase complex dimerization subunit type 1 TsaB [Eubacterium sp.]
MLLLSVDSSAVTASAALTENGSVIKSELINKGLTHSETLLPLIESVMQGYDYKNLDAIAVTAGPGSFTGVRIGVATVKGIAFPYDIPCISVSTLEAIAYNFTDENAVICAVMDARRMQFYNALFKAENGEITRLCDDRAISLEDLKKDLEKYEHVIIAGDGAKLCY